MTALATTNPTTITQTGNFQALLAERAKKMQRNLRIASNNISTTRTGQLSLPNGNTVDSLECVVLEYAYRNQWFEKPFAKGEFNTVSCQAVGDEPNDDLIPSPDSAKIQAKTCKECPKNGWNSSPTGRGKACKNQILLAVIPVNIDENAVWTAIASPTSIKLISPYLVRMVDTYEHPVKVLTVLSVDMAMDYPRLQAEFFGKNELWEVHAERLIEAQRMLYSTATSTPFEQVSSAPALATGKNQVLES
jgi:hypothetical protein